MPVVKREILILIVWLLLMFLLGLMFSSVETFLLFALAIYAFWTIYNLNQLTQWLAKPKKQTPEAVGIWDDIYYQLYHMYKRQRSARKKLTSILNRFQKSTQALPYATIVLNKNNEIEWFNPAASRMFNLHVKLDIGQRLDNLIRQPVFSAYLQKKDYSVPVEFSIQQKKILLNMTPYGSGQFLVSARDITSRSQLDEMRRDFISNASHELRTPLTVMSGYIECLQHKAENKEDEILSRVQKQVSRMNTIISELIELARLESSENIDLEEKVELSTLLHDVYDEAIALDNQQHGIELIIDDALMKNNSNSGSNRLYLYGSYAELRMAFSNLLSNAIRYTPEAGRITLQADKTATGISVSVQDKGQGISYEHIPRLTERFYRVDEGRSRDKGGTGLGLSIVKHVLDRHHAQLTITSEPGQGSIFRCDFTTS